MSAPKTPSMPEPPPPAPAPPAPVEEQMPTPPPEAVKNSGEAGKVEKRTSKRKQQQQASKGASALRIPLNTGASRGASGGLNIPK